MHDKNAWNLKINEKGKGNMVLPALGEKNLAKRSEENDKILRESLYWVGERKKSLKMFWKRWVEQVKSDFFLKLDSHFDWSKINFDWSKQTEAHKKF